MTNGEKGPPEWNQYYDFYSTMSQLWEESYSLEYPSLFVQKQVYVDSLFPNIVRKQRETGTKGGGNIFWW